MASNRTINWLFVFGICWCGHKNDYDGNGGGGAGGGGDGGGCIDYTTLPIDEQMFTFAIDIFNLSLIANDA